MHVLELLDWAEALIAARDGGKTRRLVAGEMVDDDWVMPPEAAALLEQETGEG
jgi:glutamine phosphoribosylpyrophosphate amidotransferase